jgi:hypothetical protein
MRVFSLTGVIAALCFVIAACSERPASVPAGSGMEFRMEAYCSVKGLSAALRHTYILIDERILTMPPASGVAQPSETGATQQALNPAVRDAVLAFADPLRATQTKASDYRERVTILLAPQSGAAAEVLFAGCIPGLNPQELTAARDRGSAIGAFFTGGADQQLTNDRDEFRRRVALALGKAAGTAKAAPARAPESLADSPLVGSLRASGNLINSEYGIPRLIVLSNLARVSLGEATTRPTARAQGFRDGARAGLDLGRAEIHVFLVSGSLSALARDYVETFFLAQQGRLLSWSAGNPSNLPPPPVKVLRFEGKAVVPSYSEDQVALRIALDQNNALVNSWIIERANKRSTPLTGLQLCDSDGACSISSDDGGFAQIWRDLPDSAATAVGDPAADETAPIGVSVDGPPMAHMVEDQCPELSDNIQFCVYYPFVGLRSWKFRLTSDGLDGALTDPGRPQIGPVEGNVEFKIDGRETPDARF